MRDALPERVGPLDSREMLFEQYQSDSSAGVKPEQTVTGGQWVVEIYSGYVVKRPRDPKNTAAKLHARQSEALAAMQVFYHLKGFGKVPVPDMHLFPKDNFVLQPRATGIRLAELSDDELAKQPPEILEALDRLMACTLEVRKKIRLVFGLAEKDCEDFIDIPGWNLDIPWFKRFPRGVQSRYSTNIFTDSESGKIAFVDPDWAYVSTQSRFRMLTVMMAKGAMLKHMQRFRDQLHQLI